MTPEDQAATAAALRQKFDERFQKPRILDREPEEEILRIRAHDFLLAVRTTQASGVLHCPRIVPLPSPAPALLGICGIRGALVAAFSLAALLGGPASFSRGWILLCDRDRTMGLVFDELQGCLRIPTREIRKPAGDTQPTGIAGEVVRIFGENRAVIQIPAVLENVRSWSARTDTQKE
jgi:chemotaxis signal transduction protein